MVERQHINALPKELQSNLRKKKYQYQRPAPASSSGFNSTPYADKPVKLVCIATATVAVMHLPGHDD